VSARRAGAFVPRAQSTDKRFFGVVEAIVVDVIDPDKEGKVKIQFPWFDEEMVTEYCRVRQFYAGKGYGAFFVPEKGDEVLVAFVHGDMRMPIILGGLYNGEDKPSTDRQKDKDQKLIRTKAGHELLFDDSEKERRIKLTTASQHVLDLDDKDKKVFLKTAQGHALTLDDGEGKVTLETSGGQSLTFDLKQGKATLKATQVTVEATTVSVNASHVDLGSGASQPVILGTTFATYLATHVHTTGVPGLPTSPPVTPMPPTALSTKVFAG
jgi:uncharacterized protein involved in type VI secretion and phage assembly